MTRPMTDQQILALFDYVVRRELPRALDVAERLGHRPDHRVQLSLIVGPDGMEATVVKRL